MGFARPELYDAIYAGKDYAAEAEAVAAAVLERRPAARTLLDVACGTGRHLELLHDRFEVEGVDSDPAMLAVARERLSAVTLHEADMRDFDLGRRFDAVVCLFSSIGYVGDEAGLRSTCRALARHLLPGGVLLVEPWFTPDAWVDGFLGALFVDEPQLKLARMSIAARRGGVSVLDLHHLLATPRGIESFVEHHELGLFTVAQQLAALRAAGLEAEHLSEWAGGRGLYAAVSHG